jgi:hypothetical protein
VTRGRFVVHAHFYQPLRADPFTGVVIREPAAAPYHDWNERIDAECYRPNAERGNLGHISHDLGPTLAAWLKGADPGTYQRFVAADAPNGVASPRGNAMAQPYHHTILPLASLADRRTEIRWGIRDFALRYGRPPDGMWLPETAVDLVSLRLLAEAGIRYTILAPWQSVEASIDTRRLYRVELGGGRSIGVAFYDGPLSAAISFDPSATEDADVFVRDRLIPRFGLNVAEQEALRAASARRGPPGSAAAAPWVDGSAEPMVAQAPSPVIVVASDGELYGHHQKFRDLFLHRLVVPRDGDGRQRPDRGFDVVMLAAEFTGAGDDLPPARVAERTSWSCHHGVARWSAECPDAADGRWKGPLRAALDRLAAGIDAVTIATLKAERRTVDMWAARDDYVDVVDEAATREEFASRWLGARASAASRDRFLDLLEGQRWRLAMYASDAWFWDDPVRPETRQVLRAAARAVRLVDGVAGTQLEGRLCDDLSLFSSPSRGIDGLAIYRDALSEIGQPAS